MAAWLPSRQHGRSAGRRAARLRRAGRAALTVAPLLLASPTGAVSIGAVSIGAAQALAAPSPGASVNRVTADAARDARAGALPRQFSVEVAAGGVLFADGTRLGASSELERWARRARAGARFAGAVVFGDEAGEGAAIGEIVELLRRAGFAEVRRAGRPAPRELSAVSRGGAPPVVAARQAGPTNVAPATASARSPRAKVSLATMGLHVAGELNREPHRGQLVRVFEREFKAFRRCHEQAERHAQGASFGVDLLIPKAGGRGKVRQSRTRLSGKEFRACMRAVFESIHFAPPPSARDEIVSYSVLFKPSAR